MKSACSVGELGCQLRKRVVCSLNSILGEFDDLKQAKRETEEEEEEEEEQQEAKEGETDSWRFRVGVSWKYDRVSPNDLSASRWIRSSLGRVFDLCPAFDCPSVAIELICGIKMSNLRRVKFKTLYSVFAVQDAVAMDCRD